MEPVETSNTERERGQPRTGVPTHIVDAVVAFLILIMGLVVVQGSWKLGSGWTTDGPGAGYFPFYIGLILCISGAGSMYQALFGKTVVEAARYIIPQAVSAAKVIDQMRRDSAGKFLSANHEGFYQLPAKPELDVTVPQRSIEVN